MLTGGMQVNVATRDAALAPGGMDSMAFFEGSYCLMPLNTKTTMKPVEVLIATNNGEPLQPSHHAACGCARVLAPHVSAFLQRRFVMMNFSRMSCS